MDNNQIRFDFVDQFTESGTNQDENLNTADLINIPYIGEKSVAELSLPFVTIVLGILDGFNPCAMWILLFLISMLLGVKDSKKRWILGSAFIITSGLIYVLFMTAWLNLFLMIGYVKWIRIIIGLVAIGAGSYNLYDYFTKKEEGCGVIDDKKRKDIFGKIKRIIKTQNIFIALFGICSLAIGVNMIEMVCSAGLPAIFSSILSLSNLSMIQYIFYIALYIFFFMLDDMIVFGIAMVTLQVVGINSKYEKLSRIIGGIIILIVGLLLIIKPELLMFG